MSDIPSAPLVLIGFNRTDTLKRMLANLSKCNDLHRNNREAFAFLDGARKPEEITKVQAVRSLVEEFRDKYFPTLNIVARERNYGCRGNIVDAISSVLERFGRAIIIEDDILVSRTFLTYMDNALEFYQDDLRIWCINANTSCWMKVPRSYKHDVYLHPRNMCWGWGTWKDRWEKVDFEMSDWPQFRSNPDNLKKLDELDISLKWMLDSQFAGRLKTWDVQCSFHVMKNGLYAIEPRYALSKNCGFGTDSEHCRSYSPAISSQKYYNFIPRLEQVNPDRDVLCRLGASGVSRTWCCRFLRKIYNVACGLGSLHDEPIDLQDNNNQI